MLSFPTMYRKKNNKRMQSDASKAGAADARRYLDIEIVDNMDKQGCCEHCGKAFTFRLIHNGFNESAYAYCADCGTTAILDTLYQDRQGFPRHRSITAEAEEFIKQCQCGGSFRAGAWPRCPWCNKRLSPECARTYIERSVSGAPKSWRWQNNWEELYCIIIEDRVVLNNWKKSEKTR